MQLKSFFILFILSHLTACVSNSTLKTIEPSYLFHSNNSKVWLVNHTYKNGRDYAPISMKYKQLIIFYSSGKWISQQVNDFAEGDKETGYFDVSLKKNQITFEHLGKSKKYNLKMISSNRIILENSEKDTTFTLDLIPLPEF